MQNFLIREAQAEDAIGLRQCMIAAYSSYAEKLKGISLPPLEADYALEIANYPSWVAERDGKIVGGLIMTFADDWAGIANVAVHPDAQGCGLGRGLLEFAEQRAREKGITRMRLATHTLLTENVSLYQHLGWGVVSKDSVRITMQKPLV